MLDKVLPRHLRNILSTALRVARTKNRIGLFQMALYAASLLTLPLDLVLERVQRSKLPSSEEPRLPLVFISGYARSGTTLIYQALAKVWPVEYFNNLLVLFPRSYLLVNRAFRKLCRRRPQRMENFYGLTMGLSGTNDGPQIFYRWLDEEDYIQGRPISLETAASMRRFFAAYQEWSGQPTLSKNCNNYLIFGELARHLPTSWFIFVRRDPARVIRSTLKARQFVQGDSRVPWEFSLNSRQRGGTAEDPIEEICLNVRECYRRVEALRETIPEGRLIEISYEDFCRDPAAVIADLSRRIFGVEPDPARLRAQLSSFKISSGPPVNSSEMDRIGELVSRHM